MKKTMLITLGLIVMVLNSCKKDMQQEVKQDLAAEKVTTWLKQKINPSQANRARHITTLEENLDFSRMSIEGPIGLQVAVIPINDAYKTYAKIEQSKTLYLVVYFDKNRNVRNEQIAIYTPPANQQAGVLNAKTFYNITYVANNITDGKYRFLSVSGQQLYDLEYKKGKMFAKGLIGPKDTPDTDKQLFQWIESCTEYWRTTRFYDENGVVFHTTSTYLGKTCEYFNDETVDYIAPPEGGGGGGSTHYEFSDEKKKIWAVGFINDTAYIYAKEKFTIYDNYWITGMVGDGSFGSKFPTFATYEQVSHWGEGAGDYLSAKTYVIGKVTFDTDPGSPQSVSGQRTWTMADFR